MSWLIDIVIAMFFGLILCGIYWVVGFFCKSTFNFEIRKDYGYGVCIVGGFAVRNIIFEILKNQIQ